MAEEIVEKSFDELDSDLQEKVIENFLNDDYLLPDDWYQSTLDDIIERHKELDIDEKSIGFDVYRNDYEWEGTIEYEMVEGIKDAVPERFFKYIDDTIVYDLNVKFENSEIENDFHIDDDLIIQNIKDEIFPNDYEFVDNGKVEISIDGFRSSLEQGIKKYKEYSEPFEILTKWLEAVEISEMFFQDTVELEEEEVDVFTGSLRLDFERDIHECADKFYDFLNNHISEVHDEYSQGISKDYEYYTSREYAIDNLSSKTFDVTVEIDEDGNEEQIGIDDLNGNW